MIFFRPIDKISMEYVKEARKGFLQLMFVPGQLNRKISYFCLLKQSMDWLMTGMLNFVSRHFMTSYFMRSFRLQLERKMGKIAFSSCYIFSSVIK